MTSRLLHWFSAAIAFAAIAPAAAADGSIRRFDRPVAYPAACLNSETGAQEMVMTEVAFTVGKDRLGKNVRVIKSDDACFDDAAIAAARTSIYLPAASGQKIPQEAGFTQKFLFSRSGGEITGERDVSPILRIPPFYPQPCFRKAEGREVVVVEFDVNSVGRTENARVIDATNDCFSEAARKSVEGWRYDVGNVPEGPPVFSGVRTEVAFELVDGAPPKARKALREKLEPLRKRIAKRPDEAAAVLQQLELIEAELGAGFTARDLFEFYRLRAAAYLEQGESLKALDDLVFASQGSGGFTALPAIFKAIIELKALAPELSKANAVAEAPISLETSPKPE